ncbi:PIN2/TERF1-interacting telomerase inhibitor 1 [Periophthalmus magnuspinnatus]|uniref:PIN2/TERF1-interacting telomerase inhibitor 1 n=1 Tax=Periophthalmus magnuspinnatus TaxID=409849 RepID=UPI00145A4C65|nr:PIN2/TERF1-interacting telomerase inhibitor 1 [Periophthalmus magnuspinnatus]
MSMLAEPRRKQKWSVDPRNSAWSKDDSKFGQKMLERMGWSKGKGLGRSEQGATEHIKVKVKNDSYGLGANASHEDNWIAHQDDFNELLAQLNSCHGQNDNNVSPPEEQKGFSLEEKSKTARKRVHYMKFTKGKDLSSRSEKDLNCIFGKRGLSKEQDQESNSSESQEEKEETAVIAPTGLDTESIANTVTSTLTMQEYFAQRMARLKKAHGQAPTSDTSEKSGENSPMYDANNCSMEPKKKKKKKDNKKAADEAEVSEKCEAPVSEEQKLLEQRNPEKKKKKKRKMLENEQPLTPEEELLPSKKKKNKKHKDETEQINGHLLAEEDNVQSQVNEKQKHDNQVESVFEKKKSKKGKKGKHNLT